MVQVLGVVVDLEIGRDVEGGRVYGLVGVLGWKVCSFSPCHHLGSNLKVL